MLCVSLLYLINLMCIFQHRSGFNEHASTLDGDNLVSVPAVHVKIGSVHAMNMRERRNRMFLLIDVRSIV